MGPPSLEVFVVPQNPRGVAGVFPEGHFFSTAGSDTYRNKRNKYIGTVAETQKAGTVDVGFLARNKKGNQFTDVLRVVVLETAKKYEPTPGGAKVEVADLNNVSEEEKKKIIAVVKAVNTNLPANSTYNVDEKGNLVITYPDKSTDKISAAYLVTPAAKDAEKYTPTAKAQTVTPGSTPNAKDSIGNAGDLPSGTTLA